MTKKSNEVKRSVTGFGIGLCVCLMAAISLPALAQSGAPPLLPFHGRLVGSTGQPITTPTHIRIQIIQGGTAHGNPTRGRVVFTEQAEVTPDETGYFDYMIGSNADGRSDKRALDAKDLNTTEPVFVEVALIGEDGLGKTTFTLLLPRQQMVSVGYALQAEMAKDAAVDDRFVNVAGDKMTGPLTVAGPIESMSGGVKFPDGTLQTTAALGAVVHDFTLAGNGTSGTPLRIADGGVGTNQLVPGAVTGSKIASGQVVKSLNGMFDNVTLAAGANITVAPSGNTLTVAAPNALASVSRNSTLTGNGTSGSPLSVAVPLNLSGTVHGIDGIIDVSNSGEGFAVVGASSNTFGAGVLGSNTVGIGVQGTSRDGDGVFGATANGAGIHGVSTSGIGVLARSLSGHIIEGRTALNNDVRFRVENDGDVRADGTFASPAADFAEMMEVEESGNWKIESYQPGDVLIISPETGKLTKGHQPYCPLVAGVYSTKPAFLGGHEMDEKRPGQVPLAVLGIVPCKVTAENGPIAIGDLLVTSSTPGHAMKGTDRSQMLGAIVGKALEPLSSGAGTIKVLVTLQ
jgi:hypothetical protein